MNKTILTTALACVLTLFGVTVSAENYTPQNKVEFNDGVLSSKGSESLKILAMSNDGAGNIALGEFLTEMASTKDGDKTFGYLLNGGKDGSKFVSLAEALSEASAGITSDGDAKIASVSLGKFDKNDTIQFGYADSNGQNFTPTNIVKVGSDSGYHGGFDPDSFFKLDFSEDPFDGSIEIYVMGEPLPASTVTLIVALAAGAALMLYNNRRRRIRGAEQA